MRARLYPLNTIKFLSVAVALETKRCSSTPKPEAPVLHTRGANFKNFRCIIYTSLQTSVRPQTAVPKHIGEQSLILRGKVRGKGPTAQEMTTIHHHHPITRLQHTATLQVPPIIELLFLKFFHSCRLPPNCLCLDLTGDSA